jgi:predicted SprT family Zn-dependent metalloprotease
MLITELRDFRLRAIQTMFAFGLDDWTFRWDNRKNAAGLCSFTKREIRMSKFIFPLAGEKQNRDTLLHECAHALAFIHDNCVNHGVAWKRWCVKIGANPQATVDVDVAFEKEIPYKYYLIDKRNAEVLNTFHRRPRKNYETFVRRGDPASKGQLKLVTHADLKLYQNKACRDMLNR